MRNHYKLKRYKKITITSSARRVRVLENVRTNVPFVGILENKFEFSIVK
jgi:hypothetical protein